MLLIDVQGFVVLSGRYQSLFAGGSGILAQGKRRDFAKAEYKASLVCITNMRYSTGRNGSAESDVKVTWRGDVDIDAVHTIMISTYYPKTLQAV